MAQRGRVSDLLLFRRRPDFGGEMKQLSEFFRRVSGPAITFTFAGSALAADTLPAVSPPTDWTGVIVVMGFGLLLAAALVVGYVVHVRRTPGKQLGEEEIERIAELLYLKQRPPSVFQNTPPTLIYDGNVFADEAELEKYKAAKALLDSYKLDLAKGETP